MYFPKYGLGKPQLDKYLKNPFLKTYMANGFKDCSNLKNWSFGIFIDQCEGN